MMFMTPMPPTSSEMAAMPASSTVRVLSTELAVFAICDLGGDGEVGVGRVGDAVQGQQLVGGLLVSAAPMVDCELASR